MYKKLLSIIVCLCITAATPLCSYAASEWTMQSPGVYQMLDGSSIDGVVSRGVDISHWQEAIDWKAVAADDVNFVMLGTRYKGEVDPLFDYNATEAAKYGIKLGAYIYSYAMTTDEAAAEADFVLNLIKDYPISYPVAFDVEDTNTQGTLSKAELTDIINTFCEKIRNAGYYPILYANDYWLANKLDMSTLDYPVWVARYNVKHSYTSPVMWQATSTGSVAGVQGNVDIDFQYVSFDDKIPANSWRTINGITYYYQNYTMQKNAWICDNDSWYYMNNEGTVNTGWFKDNNKWYFLDRENGKMLTGWKQEGDKWYFLDGSGALASGWVNPDRWYYLDNDGVMKTGWITDSGKTYYLSTSSGAMTVGWRAIDNNWYYFDQSGALTTGWVFDNNKWYYTDSNGVMLTGKIDVSGTSYYLDTDGHMLSDTDITLDEINYHIDSSGALSKIEAPAEETAPTVETTAPSAN